MDARIKDMTLLRKLKATSNRAKYPVLAFSTVISCVFLSATVYQAKAVSIKSFTASYQAYSFVQRSGHLVKPSNSKSAIISLHCVPADYCEVIAQTLKKYLIAPWLSVQQVQEFDPLALISVEVISGYEISGNNSEVDVIEKITLPVAEKEKVYHEGEKNCKYVSTVAGLEVTHALVAVNSVGDDKKYVSCILFNLARAIGMDLKPTYEQAWSKGGALTAVTDQQFDQWMRGTGRLIALHTNQKTFAGMTPNEFEKAIEGMSLERLIGE
jgi:hypothetical protein